MSEWEPQIVRIESIRKHPDADSLDVAIVLGDYPVIVKRDEYKVGDLVSYICTDTVVPDTPMFYFLSPNNIEQREVDGEIKSVISGKKFQQGSVPAKYRRIKAKRLRGIYSQGLIVEPVPGLLPGDSIVDVFQLTKYEEIEEDNLNNPTAEGHQESPPKGWSSPYYDIEGLRKYFNELDNTKEYFITEKLHGCLKQDSKITYLNGSKKPICRVQIGDTLIGMQEGKVVPSIVLRKFDNGKGGNWLKIKATKYNSGRGQSEVNITCTDEHRFFSPSANDFVKAKSLLVGDVIQVLRTDYCLSPIQEQVLLGKMLGDGRLSINSDVSALVEFCHCTKDIGYFDWTVKALGSIFTGTKNFYKSGYGSDMVRGKTACLSLIKDKFSSFINNGVKIVPEWVADELTPLSLAFWYMDDGSLSHHPSQNDRASFAVCAFTETDCAVLQRGLKKLGINSTYRTSKNKKDGPAYSRIYLNADDAERLFLLVAPYIPVCMQRKLPERYRGHEGWIPVPNNEYKPAFVNQKIISISKIDDANLTRYDLETTTNNYIANDILVHNSNFSARHDGEKLWVKSRRFYKKKEPPNMWWTAALKYDLENKLSKYPDYVFFAECYGRIKNFRYDCEIIDGSLSPNLRFFDIWDLKNLRFLDYDDFIVVIDDLELDTPTLLYRGPLPDKETLYYFAEGQSTMGSNIREGFVIKTTKETYFELSNSRTCFKLVGEGYNLKK